MTARAYERGWPIEYSVCGWIYSDTRKQVTQMRSCRRCGKTPTKEGYDRCLGYIEGAVSACCGHGVELPMVVWEDGE